MANKAENRKYLKQHLKICRISFDENLQKWMLRDFRLKKLKLFCFSGQIFSATLWSVWNCFQTGRWVRWAILGHDVPIISWFQVLGGVVDGILPINSDTTDILKDVLTILSCKVSDLRTTLPLVTFTDCAVPEIQ